MTQIAPIQKIIIIPGSWQTAEHYQPFVNAVCRELDNPDAAYALPLRAEGDDITFTNISAYVGKRLVNEPPGSVALMGHSRSGNIIPRVALLSPAVGALIFLNAGLDDATAHGLGHPLPGESVPQKYTDESRDAILDRSDRGENVTGLADNFARIGMYASVGDETLREAMLNMRPQRRNTDEDVIDAWPDVSQFLIYAADDKVIRAEWSEHIANYWLGKRLTKPAVKLTGGHSLQLSRPDELAEVVLDLLAVKKQSLPGDTARQDSTSEIRGRRIFPAATRRDVGRLHMKAMPESI